MSLDLPDLSGKTAIVTGASRGIGKALAIALGRQGCAVVCAAKSETERENLPGTIHMTAEEITSSGGRALAFRCDVRNPEEVEAMVASAVEAFGSLDIVVNNAGALWWRGVTETPLNRFDLLIDVNLRGPYLLSYLASKIMIEQGRGGHIVNLAPPVDLRMLPGKTPYLISKFGMTMLAHGLAGELAEHDIAVCNLWPATAIESQATINHQLGARENWRKPEILCDSMLVAIGRPVTEVSGRDLIDEDWLGECGVPDCDVYNCVEGGMLLYIHGPKSLMQWKDRTGSVGKGQASGR